MLFEGFIIVSIRHKIPLCCACVPVRLVVDVDAALITELGPGFGRSLVLWVVEPPVELEIVHPLERLGTDVASEDLVLRTVLELVGP